MGHQLGCVVDSIVVILFGIFAVFDKMWYRFI